MKGKKYKVYKMVRTNPYGKTWCLECDDPNLDMEALAVFNAREYKDIFHQYKKREESTTTEIECSTHFKGWQKYLSKISVA